MPGPLAYLLTWTCYGMWLHGDERGSVDDEHRVVNTPYLKHDARRHELAASKLAQPPLILNDEMRSIVDGAIRCHCDVRGWGVYALNVRTNHVHVVLGGELAPETMMGQLKSWGTRRLREHGLIEAGRRVWTNQGSNRYLWDRASVSAAVRYVENQ